MNDVTGQANLRNAQTYAHMHTDLIDTGIHITIHNYLFKSELKTHTIFSADTEKGFDKAEHFLMIKNVSEICVGAGELTQLLWALDVLERSQV